MFLPNQLRRYRTSRGCGQIRLWARVGASFVVTVLAGLVGCQEPTESPLVDESLVNLQADAVFYDMEDHLTTDGVRSGLIRADTAHMFQDSAKVHMWGVEMILFHADGSERARVTSLRGVLDRRTQSMVARGNALLTLDEGRRYVESPELHYDPDTERIWSDSNSVYTNGGRVTRGTCFRSNLEFTNLTVCNIRGAAEISPGIGRDGGGHR